MTQTHVLYLLVVGAIDWVSFALLVSRPDFYFDTEIGIGVKMYHSGGHGLRELSRSRNTGGHV